MTPMECDKNGAKIAMIDILSGAHAGAVFLCGEGAYAIGNSFEDDIVLSDEGVGPRHVKVSISKAGVGIVEASGPTRLKNRLVDAAGLASRRYPVDLTVGETRLRIASFNPPRLLTANRLIALGAGVALIASVALFRTQSVASLNWQPQDRGHAFASQHVLVSTEDQRAGAGANVQAAERFRTYLREHGLSSITLTEDGPAIDAKGAIALSDQARWRDAEIWFDTTFGERVSLISEVLVTAKKDDAAPIRVQAIWAGANPYVIDAGGNKYFEGSILQSGWAIEKIEQSAIILHRKTDRLVLRL